MLSLLTQSISNASFGIYFPKFTGTIYELLSAPVSYLEIVVSYVGAAATKSVVLGLIILATAALLVPLRIEHPCVDDPVPRADLGDVQPVRLHHRHLGRRFREAPVHPAPHHHAADLSRRQLLLHRHAAALLADGLPVQSRGLSRQRLPLELLRDRRRERRREPRHDRRLPGRFRWRSWRGSSGPGTGSRPRAAEGSRETLCAVNSSPITAVGEKRPQFAHVLHRLQRVHPPDHFLRRTRAQHRRHQRARLGVHFLRGRADFPSCPARAA